MITNLTDEDREQIRLLKNIANRRGICNPKVTTELYNRVMSRNEKVVRCNGCLIGRINKMWNALQELERKEAEEEENETTKGTEN